MADPTILHGDSRDVIKTLDDDSVDSCVTDPPYALIDGGLRLRSMIKNGTGHANEARIKGTGPRGFMGQKWDTGETAFDPAFWAEVLRVLKPGAHLLAFGGTRTFHRLACAIEDAGFEIRDAVMWHYGSGFPKSHDVSKGIDKAAGVEFEATPASGVGFMGPDKPGGYNRTVNQLHRIGEQTDSAREWQGWGTALKPATEIICLARKPLSERTVAANVLRHGTGAINIDGCRVDTADDLNGGAYGGSAPHAEGWGFKNGEAGDFKQPKGRWPANLILSYPDDEYALRPDVTPDQKRALYRWMSENA